MELPVAERNDDGICRASLVLGFLGGRSRLGQVALAGVVSFGLAVVVGCRVNVLALNGPSFFESLKFPAVEFSTHRLNERESASGTNLRHGWQADDQDLNPNGGPH